MKALLEGSRIRGLVADTSEEGVPVEDSVASLLMEQPHLIKQFRFNHSTRTFSRIARVPVGSGLAWWTHVTFIPDDWIALLVLRESSSTLLINELYSDTPEVFVWAVDPADPQNVRETFRFVRETHPFSLHGLSVCSCKIGTPSLLFTILEADYDSSIRS